MRHAQEKVARLLVGGGLMLLAGCATVGDGYWVSDYPASPGYVEVDEYRYLNPDGLWVVYDPGLMWYSVAVYPDLYWHDGYYYRRHGGYWERSPRHVGPWASYRHAPPRVKPRKIERDWSTGRVWDDDGPHPWEAERFVRRAPGERLERGPLDDRRWRDPRFEEGRQSRPAPVSGWSRRLPDDRPSGEDWAARSARAQGWERGGEPWSTGRDPSLAELRSRRTVPPVVVDQGSPDRRPRTPALWYSRRAAEGSPPPSAGEAMDRPRTEAAPSREWLRARQERPAAEGAAAPESRSRDSQAPYRVLSPSRWEASSREDRPDSPKRRFRSEPEAGSETHSAGVVPRSWRPQADSNATTEDSEARGDDLRRLRRLNVGG